MKTTSLLLLLLLLCASCEWHSKTIIPHNVTKKIDGLTIISDTINLNVEGHGVNGIIKDDKYYIQFDVSPPTDTTIVEVGFEFENKFYVFDRGGEILQQIESPKIIGNFGNDLHIQHDSIFAKPYDDYKPAYYLDETKDNWIKIKPLDYVVYEDKDYYVTSVYFGEWGGSTWFRNKRTGIEYVAEIATPEVKKVGSSYFLISHKEICLIKDPQLLMTSGHDYRKIKQEQNEQNTFDMLHAYNRRENRNYEDIGVQDIFKSDTDPFDDSFLITASLICNNELYVFVLEDSQTYLAKVSKNGPKRIIDFGDKLYITHRENEYKNSYQKNSYFFYSGSLNHFGLMEIKQDTIYLHYINNTPLNN
jgi:hypothetical protein